MATFPGSPPNPLGFKCELNLNGAWTDVTIYVMLRDSVTISNMGRSDESSGVGPSELSLTLRNDGRFTPKNSSGAYFPNIVRNCQIRISVNATSSTGVAYSGFRFFGEVSSWPPGSDISQRDTYVQITAAGIWRRISQSVVPIGSCYWRYASLLTGTSVPAAYWAMEDGSNTSGFVLSVGTGTNITATGTPGYTADNTAFPGSSAIPSMNGARMAANVSSAATPTNNVLRFALSVPAQNDSAMTAFTSIEAAKMISASGGIKMVTISLSSAGQLTIAGYTSTAGGTAAFSGTVTTKVTGVPVLVSAELTATTWALRIIKPGAGAALDQVTGSRSQTVAAVTQVQLNEQGRLQDTVIGQAGVWYTIPSLTTAASMIGGLAGELAATRFSRLCTESNIPVTITGSGGAAMGPQVSDTMPNVLQSIEDTDGGLIYETTGQFGLGYRTLASLQNQAVQATVNFAAGHLGAALAPTYDDALIRNQVSVTNYDGYVATAQLNTGAMSVLAPPSGVGQGYASSKSINAQADSQANAIATQLLMLGTVDDVRIPVVTVNFQRRAAGSLFAVIPGLDIGDYFQITNMPAFLGGGTSRQLAWGYTERMGGEIPAWTFEFNAIPELPFETTFNPGSFTVAQGTGGAVPGGSGSVSGSQITPGSIGGTQIAQTLSARTVGGVTSFIAAATPYDWAFAVTGTPADNSYFICTTDQALPIAPGDTFSNTSGLGSPFTVTSVDQPFAGFTNVHFTPDATGVMSAGTVRGGKNGDTWVNTSAGNQVNQWASGAWVPITWNAANVIAASTITAAQIAGGIVIAGIVDGTLIIGAKVETSATNPAVQMDGARDAIFGYDGSSKLLFSLAGAAGTDSFAHAYPQGLFAQQETLADQASAPSAVSGATVLYSSNAGRLRYLASNGENNVIERGSINVSTFTVGNTTTPTIVSGNLSYKGAAASNQSSTFEIEITGAFHTGSAATQQSLFQMFSDGSGIGNTVTIGAAALNLNVWYDYAVRFRLSVLTWGSSGTAVVTCDGTLAQQAIAIGSVANTHLSIGTTNSSVSFNSTIDHTLAVFAWFNGTQTAQEFDTFITRTTNYN